MTQRLLLFVCCAFLCSGCCCLGDPACLGEVSYTPGSFWAPSFANCIVTKPQSVCISEIEPPCVEDPLVFPENEKQLNAADLIHIALSNNPETRRAWADARAAYFSVGEEKSELYPQVDVRETYSMTQQFSSSTRGHFGGNFSQINNGANGVDNGGNNTAGAAAARPMANMTQANKKSQTTPARQQYYRTLHSELTISYLLLDFGERCAHVESAKQALYQANWMQNRALQDVMLSVLDSYYGYLDASSSLTAKYQDLEDAQTNLESAEALHEAGVNTLVDVLMAKSSVAETKTQLERLKGEVQVQMGKLAYALGLPADTKLAVQSLPDDLPMDKLSEGMEQLMETAKNSRPDLAAAYANFMRRKADVSAARAAGLPRVTVNGQFEQLYYWQNTTANGHSLTGSLVLEFPIFRGFFYRNQIRRTQEALNSAYASLLVKESDVLLDVVTNYYRFTTAVATYQSSLDFLTFTKETYELTLASYRMGVKSILDLVTAQAKLATARSQVIHARTSWITSIAGMAYATGTL